MEGIIMAGVSGPLLARKHWCVNLVLDTLFEHYWLCLKETLVD